MRTATVLFLIFSAISSCKKPSGLQAPPTATGTYCDKSIPSQITVFKGSVTFTKPGKGEMTLYWNDDAQGYFGQLPSRAYKLQYRDPDFALLDCKNPSDCAFSRMITKCNG